MNFENFFRSWQEWKENSFISHQEWCENCSFGEWILQILAKYGFIAMEGAMIAIAMREWLVEGLIWGI